MMWSKDKSVILSQVSTRAIMAAGALLAIALPFLCAGDAFFGRALIEAQNAALILPTYYAFCVPAYTALFSLDRLLAAVKRGEVFTGGNVRCLRVISWACFAAALVLAVAAYVSLALAVSPYVCVAFFALAVVAAFFGVVLRVVKNLFAAAVELQDESDHTI
jgi:hypothetical protein